MESPAKERLTGALILVAALVIVVPEMLQGPDDGAKGGDVAAQPAEAGPPLRTYDLVLDPSASPRRAEQETLTPQSTQSTPAEELAAVPPPVTTESPPAPAATEPAVVAVPPESAPAPVAMPPAEAPRATPPAASASAAAVPAEAAAGGRWWAQLGSFSSRENAERLARQLRTAGFAIDVSQIRSGSKELHRVRAGPVRDRAAAAALQARLAAAGHKATLIAP